MTLASTTWSTWCAIALSWSANTWQNVGAVAAGVVVSVGVIAAIVGATACTAVTFGVCGVVIIGAAVAAGAAGAAVTYGMQGGSKSVEGMAQAVGWGAAGGLAGAGAGAVIGKIVGAVASKVVSGAGAQAASKATAGAATNAAKVAPEIKAGMAGGESAGSRFPSGVRAKALDENPSSCVYCQMDTDSPQVDHVIPRSRGGNATLENAQTTCPHCNASKGARDFPLSPPLGYRGSWPPPWWSRN